MCEYVWVYRGMYGHVWVCKSGQVENQKIVNVENWKRKNWKIIKVEKQDIGKEQNLSYFGKVENWRSGKLENFKSGKVENWKIVKL